jgi:hypothetical protein
MSFKFSMSRGDDRDFEIPITRSGSAVDLTGASVRAHFKSDLAAAPVFQKSLGSGIEIEGAAADGVVVLSIDPADTAALQQATTLYFDVELTESDGRVTTVAEGTLLVRLDVTS